MGEKVLYTHNPDNFTLSIGAHIVSGFADNSMIQVELNADQVSLKVGVKGAGARSISQDVSGKITVTLWPGSPTNTFLAALADQDRKSSDGTKDVYLKDTNGQMFAHSEAMWIMKKPAADLQKEATNRVWVLETHNLEYIPAGESVG